MDRLCQLLCRTGSRSHGNGLRVDHLIAPAHPTARVDPPRPPFSQKSGYEALWFVGCVCLSLIAFPYTAAPLIYVGLVISGSWVYPLTTVHLPHNAEGENALFQTYSLRGRIIPKLFLELTYHLEHHLYPAVPSHQYRELSRRLQPYLERAGVKPVKVW